MYLSAVSTSLSVSTPIMRSPSVRIAFDCRSIAEPDAQLLGKLREALREHEGVTRFVAGQPQAAHEFFPAQAPRLAPLSTQPSRSSTSYGTLVSSRTAVSSPT